VGLVFVCIDHSSAEAWASVAVRGDRFAALEPVYDAVRDHFAAVGPDAARGVACRHDWRPQHLRTLPGITALARDQRLARLPRRTRLHRCAERFIRTLKEQCLWARHHHDVADPRAAVTDFVHRYNTEWLIERHHHATPREAYQAAVAACAA